jgi:RNA polymerase sigma-70 factor (ECF subfamily)
MAEFSDAELLARYQRGDGDALERLLMRHEIPLFHFLVGLLGNRHLAEDALQETFVRALEKLDGVDPEHFRGWLFTVAYHQAMLLRRKRRVTVALEPELPDAGSLDPAVQAEQDDEARRVRELLARLPGPQQEVIRQHVFEGKKFREIAETLACPLNTALSRMHEGLKRLRVLWGENHV